MLPSSSPRAQKEGKIAFELRRCLPAKSSGSDPTTPEVTTAQAEANLKLLNAGNKTPASSQGAYSQRCKADSEQQSGRSFISVRFFRLLTAPRRTIPQRDQQSEAVPLRRRS
eukprot:SAG11_NODE_13729_length_642_cov_0.856354_2_plen_111_part_01